jgi:bifunctional non-homologous end joining protein LigD
VLKSWAVPKGPSLDPRQRSLAVHVEDHPIDYGSFEGTIPKGEYGGGTVLLWDQGTWEPIGDAQEGYRRGHLRFALHGRKLTGAWTLARMKGGDDEADNWLLIKHDDAEARPGGPDILEVEPLSVASGRSLEQVAGDVTPSRRPASRDIAGAPGKRGARPASRDGAGKPPAVRKAVPPTTRDVASDLPGARRAAQPARLKPQLATLVDRAPEGDGWLHEVKFDGYRMLCWLTGGEVRLVTRNEHDWTARFRRVADAVRHLPVGSAILDGEIVVLDAHGRSDFQALQNALRDGKNAARLVYYLFDLPYCDGHDLTHSPLLQRRRLLADVLESVAEDGPLRYSDHVQGQGRMIYEQACRHSLEGIVSKRADSLYQERRTPAWLKVKCKHKQEFVIVGYTEPGGSRAFLGALLVGFPEGRSRLQYAGKVGTGFDARTLQSLHKQLRPLEQRDSPLGDPPGGSEVRGVHWVQPRLVAEIEFTGWTEDRRLRHPSFQGLRLDKDPGDVVPEYNPAAMSNAPSPSESARKPHSARASADAVAGVSLSNPDRVMYPQQGITKLDLARYYESVADWILPHVVRRPLSLVRCPKGQGGKCFFQKHLNETLQAPVRGVVVKEKGEASQYVVIDDLPGLITLVQFGVLEIHPWLSREDRLEQPDRLVLDLDPGPGVEWPQVVEAAELLRRLLEELDLVSFVKTTGGKGLHVVVPLMRRNTWEEVRSFAEAVAREVARAAPDRYVATMTRQKRTGRIFIDYLRNARGATAVAAYSTRARLGASVSTPLTWDELRAVDCPDIFSVTSVSERLGRIRRDPWPGFFDARQSITGAMRRRIGLST